MLYDVNIILDISMTMADMSRKCVRMHTLVTFATN